jgi:CBS domain-containing protein
MNIWLGGKMTVAWILKQKGRSVVSASAEASLDSAISLLDRHNIGAIVIVDEQRRILGIVSERDIVRIMATRGAGVLGEPVSMHMTRDVAVCGEHHSIDWLMEQMTVRRFRHIPVAESGRLAGIVSIGDVVKHKLALAEAETAQMRQYIAAG